jgi:hypothetical protein
MIGAKSYASTCLFAMTTVRARFVAFGGPPLETLTATPIPTATPLGGPRQKSASLGYHDVQNCDGIRLYVEARTAQPSDPRGPIVRLSVRSADGTNAFGPLPSVLTGGAITEFIFEVPGAAATTRTAMKDANIVV